MFSLNNNGSALPKIPFCPVIDDIPLHNNHAKNTLGPAGKNSFFSRLQFLVYFSARL